MSSLSSVGTMTLRSALACSMLCRCLTTSATAGTAGTRTSTHRTALATLTGVRLTSTLGAPTRALFVAKRRRTGKRVPVAPTASAHFPSQRSSGAAPVAPVEAKPNTPASSSVGEDNGADATSAHDVPQPQQQADSSSVPPTERPRRRYSVSSAAADQQVQRLKQELLHARLRLAKAEQTKLALYESVLGKLDETDRAAQKAAASLRYTGMALRCAHDNLEVELRRLMTIGLTAGEVDAAAVEAGARQYIRQNIGFHAEHVAREPSSVTDVVRESRTRSRSDTP
ncbi:putative mitochondrial hypothetical protein [Leptomonas pyrrhocoris]|uniref:Uncharacterized protein n=1 Tax=Leptomonas pyrrhocoris TaxID=157538 RepID=A0A0M9FY40_LEPPY|nr:putative mitochondrial hypothetical protein [Leptomonas pyrrhocoris]KPA78299.1 putative mitochondrial hypothetical protein [Leptomonas pyrrhocoris]|eukprot:XP_015656738.1 putative mitochondrial hypothetical protein [Leptomonas pyrrhocoris]